MRDWLAGIGVDPTRQADILLATSEVVTNAVRWSADSSASHRVNQRGRGLRWINGLADHVETVRTPHGTPGHGGFDRVVTG